MGLAAPTTVHLTVVPSSRSGSARAVGAARRRRGDDPGS